MEKPVISVIIVSYNHSHYVTKCLNSLLQQTYKNWELIVADDASPDSSTEVINDWLNNKNIEAKKVFHSKNAGFCRTLNECILLAKGDFIKIIAADDVMLPELLEQSYNRLNSLPEDYAMVYSNARFIDENDKLGKIIFTNNFNFDRNRLQDILFKNNMILALTAMFRAEIFNKIGNFNPDFIIEDYEYWLRIAKNHKIDYINEVLGLYRQHSGNITKRIDLEEEVVRIKIYHDTEGKYSKIILNNITELYRQNRISDKIIQAYKNYKGKSKGLYLFLKYRISYKLYNLKNKLLYK